MADSALFATDERFVERYCPGPGRLIDLGCGTGRLLIPLARRGWWVLGVDLSAEMLAVARDKARDAGVSVNLLQANLAELGGLTSEQFDHATCLFSTFGMVVGTAARQQVLAQAWRLLRPGGRLALHVHNRWFRLWDRPGRGWLAGDLLSRLKGDSGIGDHVMPAHQGVTGLTLHLFSRGEILALLKEAGFHILAVEPVSVGPAPPCCLANWRAYGFLIAAEKR